jgi:HupH hydrogenase expression protein, C-terminal conserved region
MSRLGDIPVRIEGVAAPAGGGVATGTAAAGLGGGVAAILNELAGMLERLATDRQSGAIDLRSLPMNPYDRSELQRVLGEGELQTTLDAEGPSNIRETRIAGVWWVEHRDRHGQLIAELIEVAAVPALLVRASDEIEAGARELRAQLAAAATDRTRPAGGDA